MCKLMTRDQFRSLREAPWPTNVVELAVALYNGTNCRFALHDALLDAGHAALAAHFADPEERHRGRGSGPAQCWALNVLRGEYKRRHLLIGSYIAAGWLGLTPAQFRRLAKTLHLEAESSYLYQNMQFLTGRRSPCGRRS